jgi:hypothetical protein
MVSSHLPPSKVTTFFCPLTPEIVDGKLFRPLCESRFVEKYCQLFFANVTMCAAPVIEGV